MDLETQKALQVELDAADVRWAADAAHASIEKWSQRD